MRVPLVVYRGEIATFFLCVYLEMSRERDVRRWIAGECLLYISVHGTFGYGASTVNDFGHFRAGWEREREGGRERERE